MTSKRIGMRKTLMSQTAIGSVLLEKSNVRDRSGSRRRGARRDCTARSRLDPDKLHDVREPE
jgi:hypothetical protein